MGAELMAFENNDWSNTHLRILQEELEVTALPKQGAGVIGITCNMRPICLLGRPVLYRSGVEIKSFTDLNINTWSTEITITDADVTAGDFIWIQYAF